MKFEGEASFNEEGRPFIKGGLKVENEVIGLIALGVVAVAAVVIVDAVCKTKTRRGSLEIMNFGRLFIGK